MPREANHWAIPEPITPEPITAVFVTHSLLVPSGVSRDPGERRPGSDFWKPRYWPAENHLFSAARDRGTLRTGLRRHVDCPEPPGNARGFSYGQNFLPTRKPPATREPRHGAKPRIGVFPCHESSASPSKRARGAMPSMRPMAIAFEAGIKSPRRITFKARGRPESRGRRVEPPHAGIRPRFTSGSPMRVDLFRARHPIIAGQRQLEPSARACAMNRGDRHALKRGNPGEVCWPRSTSSARLFVPASSLQVGSSDEDGRLRALEDHATEGLPVQFIKNLRKSVKGPGIQHVDRTFRPVESNDRYCVFTGVQLHGCRVGRRISLLACIGRWGWMDCGIHKRSSQSAAPCPPPTHRLTRACRPLRRCSSFSAVRTRRAPLAAHRMTDRYGASIDVQPLVRNLANALIFQFSQDRENLCGKSFVDLDELRIVNGQIGAARAGVRSRRPDRAPYGQDHNPRKRSREWRPAARGQGCLRPPLFRSTTPLRHR